MNYANIKTHDIANGPGVRVSLFVSGCTIHCPECFNKEAWDYEYGEEFTNDTLKYILEKLKPYYIKGFSVLGGEPLSPPNVEEVIRIVKKVRETYPEKPIWVYTGYPFEDCYVNPVLKPLWKLIDVLVDGSFEVQNKVIDLRFRGSTNQRIIDIQRTLKEGNVVLYDISDKPIEKLKTKYDL